MIGGRDLRGRPPLRECVTALIDRLNQRFAIPGRVECTFGRGGLPLLRIHNDRASADLCLYGGQVLDYRHAGDPENRLFLSRRAWFEAGRAIKGGIPICWPWFGADPDGAGRGAHGFARTREWTLEQVRELDREHTEVQLSLQDDAASRDIWPFRFLLTLRVIIGPGLQLTLTTHNRDTRAFLITQALHTYFAVDDIARTHVDGLDGLDYLDKVLDFTRLQQTGPVTFHREVDRIYQGVDADLTICNGHHRIRIAADGSATAVVWNPWEEGARDMADLDDTAYRHFVCVETANAADEVIAVKPGQQWTLGASYSWLDSA
jgi:glucose-6-phosphate 1-epimerase